MLLPRGDARLWGKSLSHAELGRHLALVASPASSTTVHGARLEQLAAWLFPHLPGMRVLTTNVLSAGRDHEVDIPIYNDVSVPGSLVSLGTTLFVECKNYDHPMGGQEVAWFDHKLIQGGCDAGVLLAARGVTGTPHDRTFARAVIAAALSAKPSRRILVVTLDDLATITSTDDLRELLIRRILECATGNAI